MLVCVCFIWSVCESEATLFLEDGSLFGPLVAPCEQHACVVVVVLVGGGLYVG